MLLVHIFAHRRNFAKVQSVVSLSFQTGGSPVDFPGLFVGALALGGQPALRSMIHLLLVFRLYFVVILCKRVALSH